MMLCLSMVLFSCKKQIAEKVELQSEASLQTVNANPCRPAIFGAYNGAWRTLAQKWYSNGKVKYLKAVHGGWTGTFLDPILDYMFILDWGEVSYQGNQVYLTDVTKNQVMLRVTLDNYGRPVASYYDYSPSPGSFMRDTTYYYYNSGRLESIISLYKITYSPPFPSSGWRKYVFSYDSWGNVVKAEQPGNERLTVQYDYTQPVQDLTSNFHITSSLKLLEYLELLKLPMHHAVIRTNWGFIVNAGTPDEFFSEVRNSAYKNYLITNELVRSYEVDLPVGAVTFYNGWDCGLQASLNDANRMRNEISNLQKFQEMYEPSLRN